MRTKAWLAQPDNPFYGISSLSKLSDINEKFTGIPWYNVVKWEAVLVAMGLHLFAHAVLRLHNDG